MIPEEKQQTARPDPFGLLHWLVDTNNLTGYAQVFEERMTTGGPTPTSTVRVYTYGAALISQATSLNAQPATLSYYASDGHGSIRELTDAGGTVTDRYDYDAFGILVFCAGATANAFLYCGEQFDGDLGLYYNRARYLNTDSGRFWSMDEFEGRSRSNPKGSGLAVCGRRMNRERPLRWNDSRGETANRKARPLRIALLWRRRSRNR